METYANIYIIQVILYKTFWISVIDDVSLIWIPFAEKEPMTLSTRMKIALDVARGLEYIHDHSVPVYIHRDIKSDNILLNENFTGKV